MRQDGFTLLELILVIMLIGILAVTATSTFDAEGYDLYAARQELVDALRYAQEKSLANTSTDNTQYYRVTLAAAGYTVELNDGTNVRDPFTGAPSFTQSWGPGTTVTAPAAGSFVSFNGRGEPVCNPDCTGANFTVTLTNNGVNETVTVERLTGFSR